MSRYHSHQRISKKNTNAVKKSGKYKIVDRATLVVAVLEPLITIPQALDIFREHTAAGVSLSTWVGYEVLTVVWLWYGYVHRDKMIIIYQGLFMIIQTIVIIGGVIYGAKW